MFLTESHPDKPRYINEIDTLRAIAVLLVVVFHAYPPAARGGFIGVDVFFVISGFVIARAYLFDLLNRRTTLRSFWSGRFRRLSPALFLMLGVVSLLAVIVIQPDQLLKYGQSLLAQPFYVQNFVFWSEGDYFEAGHTKPLLHTWSLDVEEQFYLFFGLAVIIFRFAPKLFLPVLVILTIASLGLSHYVEPRSPKTVFFLLPSRMWQLALGIFAMYIGQKIGRRGASINHILVLVCFATILACGIVFDETATFPGWQAYIACLATAIALVALDLQTRSLPILSFSPFSYIGKLSYGFYLWHWPAITLWFLGTQRFPSPATAFVLMLFSFGAAAASYHFVEVPIRKRQFLQNGRALRQFVLGGMATTFAVAGSLLLTNGALPLYPSDLRPFFLAANDHGSYRCPKTFRILNPEAEFCPLSQHDIGKGVLILGDSHADVLDEMLTRAAHDTQTPLSLTVRNCDLGQYGSSSFCSSKVLDKIISGAKKDGVSTIFAISKWSEDIDPEAFKEQVQRLVDADLDVVIMEMVPTDESFDPIVRARRALSDKTPPSLEGIPLQTYLARTERQRHLFAAVSQNVPERVKVLSPSNELCDRDTCHFHTDGVPNYSDSNHLTHIGAESLKPMFADVFEQLGNSADPK